MPDDTARTRTLTISDLASVAADDDQPIPRRRGRSEALSAAGIDLVDAMVMETVGKQLEPKIKAALSNLLTEAAEQASASDAVPKLGRSASLAWGITGFLAVALGVGALVATWDRMGQLEEDQQEAAEAATAEQDALEDQVEEDQRKAELYDQNVANFLVVKSANDHANALAADRLLRAVATKVGADITDIPAPKHTHPSSAIQRKHNDYEISRND